MSFRRNESSLLASCVGFEPTETHLRRVVPYPLDEQDIKIGTGRGTRTQLPFGYQPNAHPYVLSQYW